MDTLRVTLGLAVLLGALSGCFEGSTGGSETTNGLSGVILGPDGKPAAGSEVTLVPESYHPVPGKDARSLRQTRADSEGKYRFARIEPGNYNLEARDSAQDLKLLVRGVEVKAARDTPAKADGVLAKTGALQMPFADRSLPAGAIAYIPGTTWYSPAEVGQAAMVSLVRLPPGRVPEVKVGFLDSTADLAYALAESVEILPAEVVALGPVQAWKHKRALRLDLSTVPGADALRGFPVLLRLNPGDIDFAGAAPDGRDLRFFRSGIRLAHQVELWDRAGGKAAVWIRLDSVPGSPGDTSVSMHWGREDALDVSSGPGVFAAGAGFSSVWHLGEIENDSAGGYRDAAASGAHATSNSAREASRMEAPAGFGKRFGEGGGWLTAPMPAGFGGNASFSISFWMNFADAPKRQNILYFGRDTSLLGFHFFIRTDTTAQIGPFDNASGGNPSALQNHFSIARWLKQWTHVATVYDGQAQKLTTYVNGTVAAVNDLSGLQIETAPGVFLGSSWRGESAFDGPLDEVRFYDRPISPAWIRAEYEISKESSASLQPK